MKKTTTHEQPLGWLVSKAGGYDLALPVLRVREIVNVSQVVPLPQQAAHMRGCFMLRERLIPLIDLGYILSGEQQSLDQPVIIVEQGQRRAGLIVESVHQVIECKANGVQPIPEDAQSQPWLPGIVSTQDGDWLTVDIDKLFAHALGNREGNA